MIKRIIFISLVLEILPAVVLASTSPIVSIGVGSDRANISSTKNITLIAPFYNTYIGHHYDSEMVGNIFIGGETSLPHNWLWQWGASFYQNSAFQANGNINQFGDPAFNNLTYNYSIQSRRYLAETKLLYTLRKIFHPYVLAGLGTAVNNSYGYAEFPITSDAVPMQQTFQSRTQHSFTYSLGLGMDMDVYPHYRLGVSYRFMDLGQAGLGTIPAQDSTDTLSYNHLKVNEVLFQLSYVC